MEDFIIPSTRKVEGSYYNEPCEIKMEDFNRLAYLALSLTPEDQDSDITEEAMYYRALIRFLDNNKDNVTVKELRKTFDKINDDMITKLLFIQNISLMIYRSLINDDKSYETYMAQYEDYQKSLKGNKFQKANPDINTFMSRFR